MITLLASLTGFISSIFPDVLRLMFDRNDKRHELEILDRQMKLQKMGHVDRLEEISMQADISEARVLYNTFKTGVMWVDALNGTVRPVLAYAFFALYAGIKLLQYKMIGETAALSVYLDILWTTEDQAIFAGIISFYYGQRALQKIRGGR